MLCVMQGFFRVILSEDDAIPGSSRSFGRTREPRAGPRFDDICQISPARGVLAAAPGSGSIASARRRSISGISKQRPETDRTPSRRSCPSSRDRLSGCTPQHPGDVGARQRHPVRLPPAGFGCRRPARAQQDQAQARPGLEGGTIQQRLLRRVQRFWAAARQGGADFGRGAHHPQGVGAADHAHGGVGHGLRRGAMRAGQLRHKSPDSIAPL